MADEQVTDDRANYRKMSEPHESSEAANKALNDFQKELSELRKKYKIANILMIVNDSYLDGEGDASFMSVFEFGSQLEMEAMAAYGLGQAQARRAEMITRVLMDAKRGKVRERF